MRPTRIIVTFAATRSKLVDDVKALMTEADTMMDIIIDFDPKMSNQGGAFLRAVHCIRDMKVKAHSEDYFLAKCDCEYHEPYIGVLEGMRWQDEENARYVAADEEERKQKEQEEALKLGQRKQAEREKQERWYRKRRQSRHNHSKRKCRK